MGDIVNEQMAIYEQEKMAILECLDCSFHYDNRRYRRCLRCDRLYCSHFASAVDPMFCTFCLSDITLEDTIIKKTVASKSLSGKKTFYRTMTARYLVFKGEDWMFAQRRVGTLSDSELELMIEYHREIKDRMLDERENRKIEANRAKLKKMITGMSGASGKIPGKNGVNTDGSLIGLDATTVTTTTVKRTRISATQTNSAQVAVQQIMALLKAKGMTEEQAKATLIGMAGK
jgi:hypothetical protein